MGRILIVDDEEKICWALDQCLREEGHTTLIASNAGDALDLLRGNGVDLILMDLKLPGMDGMEALSRIRESGRKTPVILMTAHGTVQSSIQAMQQGAYDYLFKPLDLHEVRRVVAQALRHRAPEEGVILPDPAVLERYRLEKLVGKSREMQEVFKMIGLLSINDATVLIQGESGVGKELVARAIHFNGSRRESPFVAINCTALQDTLLESELFGYEKGAFTGAGARTEGKFDLAHGGTLFLDEVGDMSPALQGKVLRVLQEKTFYRVGGRESVSVDARVIAATHRDLEREVREGRFREDLYYRLNVVSIRIPPLRERKEDIPYLITHFLRRFSKEMGTEFSGVDEGVMTAFGNHPWPGNVREMENVLKRAAVLSRGAIIAPDHLPEGLRGVLPGSGSGGESLFTSLDLEIRRIFSRLTERESAEPSSLFLSTLREVERSLISAALEKCGWNQVRASRLLGLHRGTLRKKMADYDLVPPGNGGPSYRGDA